MEEEVLWGVWCESRPGYPAKSGWLGYLAAITPPTEAAMRAEAEAMNSGPMGERWVCEARVRPPRSETPEPPSTHQMAREPTREELIEEGRREGLREALLIADRVVMAGLLNHPLPSMTPTEVKEARDDMLSGIHEVNAAIRKTLGDGYRCPHYESRRERGEGWNRSSWYCRACGTLCLHEGGLDRLIGPGNVPE